jgi:hypothetical protein
MILQPHLTAAAITIYTQQQITEITLPNHTTAKCATQQGKTNKMM